MRSLFKILILLIVLYTNLFVFGEIEYKISGKVFYNGMGLKNIKINCYQRINSMRKKMVARTDSNGNFLLYVSSGICRLSVPNQLDYVDRDNEKIISVKDKNISNIMFFLEKGCKISGIAKFNDGTALIGSVHVSNERGMWNSDIDVDGKYTVSNIKASDNTSVLFLAHGIIPKEISNLVITEGSEINNINLNIPKRVSIYGKVIDKETKLPLKEVMIDIIDGKAQFGTFTEESGEFTFYNLDANKYYLFFDEVTFYKEKVIEVILLENEQKELLIELEKFSKEELKKKYPDMFKKN